MLRGLPYLLALLLGTSTALLAGCGGGTKSGVPSASAGELKSQITDVGQAVDDGRCDDVSGQLEQVDEGIDQLPETTDRQLVSALREGAEHLRSVAVEECQEDTGTETTETTPAETTPSETVPEEEPTETLPTETTQEPTPDPEPTPPPAPEPPPPPEPQPPVDPNPQPQPQPPVSPGGGVTPEIGPED